MPRAVLTLLVAGLAPATVLRLSCELFGLTLRGVIVEVAFLLVLAKEAVVPVLSERS